MTRTGAFTGHSRRRQTGWNVRFVDEAARRLIVVGGIGTIAAVCTVCVFLAVVALRLFAPVEFKLRETARDPWLGRPVALGLNEQGNLGWAMIERGLFAHFCLSEGQLGKDLGAVRPVEDLRVVAAAQSSNGREVAFAYEDGTLRLGRVELTTQYSNAANAERTFGAASVSQMVVGDWMPADRAMLQRIGEDQFRQLRFELVLDDPISRETDATVALVDFSNRPAGRVVCALDADGKLSIIESRSQRDFLRNTVTTKTRAFNVPYEPRAGGVAPRFLLLNGVADNLLLAWEDGHTMRFDIRDPSKPRLVEELDLAPETDARLTVASWMVGKTTLLTGDSLGRVRGWFVVREAQTKSLDGATLVAAHELADAESEVVAITASGRSRMAAAAFADGSQRLFQVTSDTTLAERQGDADRIPTRLLMSPGDDAILGVNANSLAYWDVRADHPEASFRSLFMPVWYEGFPKPAFIWQSSSGNDEFEPKYGLVPLIFGTLKATFYSLLFGVPLAILAAIYTSEFLPRKARAWIKPSIELMASLPSVVLGFLAALVLAPFIERVLPTVLMTFVCVPLAFLVCAYLWQILPHNARMRLAPWRFACIVAIALPLGPLAAYALAPAVERWLFGGDIMAYLDGQVGSGVGGWMFLWLPLASVGTAMFIASRVNPALRGVGAGWSRERWAAIDLVKFLAGCAASVGLALAVSWVLTKAGFDPRGTYIDTYVQRNSLVVGFMMGFAIIPIIYTIAEDALSTVPDHLRSASLGAGATPWQTAMRIVVPTAMSGLFSAVMIGMGRGVGETMIVLMAAGNTPILEMNIFNGFRPLPANIAVELPEAVRNSTHYRILFLSALVLFAMTFVLNTVAEVVRQRFRKRAYQL